MTYLLLSAGALAPEIDITWLDVFIVITVAIGIPLLTPVITGIIAGITMRGSDWFAGIGIGFLAGLVAIGLWILMTWSGYEYLDLSGLPIIVTYIGVSTSLCSAATVGILWLIRSRQTSTPPGNRQSPPVR